MYGTIFLYQFFRLSRNSLLWNLSHNKIQSLEPILNRSNPVHILIQIVLVHVNILNTLISTSHSLRFPNQTGERNP
jgi:hypothetical protein